MVYIYNIYIYTHTRALWDNYTNWVREWHMLLHRIRCTLFGTAVQMWTSPVEMETPPVVHNITLNSGCDIKFAVANAHIVAYVHWGKIIQMLQHSIKCEWATSMLLGRKEVTHAHKSCHEQATMTVTCVLVMKWFETVMFRGNENQSKIYALTNHTDQIGDKAKYQSKPLSSQWQNGTTWMTYKYIIIVWTFSLSHIKKTGRICLVSSLTCY